MFTLDEVKRFPLVYVGVNGIDWARWNTEVGLGKEIIGYDRYTGTQTTGYRHIAKVMPFNSRLGVYSSHQEVPFEHLHDERTMFNHLKEITKGKFDLTVWLGKAVNSKLITISELAKYRLQSGI